MEGIGILKKEMATKEEMEWYKAFNLGPGLDFKETPCTPLFRDLYECQENAVLPLRDCMLFKEDFLECVHKTKQVFQKTLIINRRIFSKKFPTNDFYLYKDF